MGKAALYKKDWLPHYPQWNDWAADLDVYSLEGNDREHIDIFYLITDQGRLVTIDESSDQAQIKAARQASG